MRHRDQVLRLLTKQIGNSVEVDAIEATADEVAAKWVSPLTGGKDSTNGLIYGLVQSGKTGVLTVTGAVGADEGYKTIIVLTSDSDPLYDQTLDRIREAFPGIDILGKIDFRDKAAFLSRIKRGTCAIVSTKNAAMLGTLIENFKSGKVRGISCLIIDDEADQASLNTRAKRDDGTRSGINQLISDLRLFFDRNTYLQVTATPQALFLQTPEHEFRPKFTVLSHPGAGYVGGDDFFGRTPDLIREFPMNDIAALSPGPQPSPSRHCPGSLLTALDTFMVGATYKRIKVADDNCAFLCHVSTKTNDHRHIVEVLRSYKANLADGIREQKPSVIARLRAAYSDLAASHAGVAQYDFDELIRTIGFYSPGITVKLVNGDTDEDVAVKSPYNLFVGGNKLGRGVTIKNLLVSYYGRHPKRPQADTVLQHARMYGYRRKDIGLLRLFLPRELHIVFRAIHRMETSLRDLISRRAMEDFRGIYLSGGVHATRGNVLAPGAIGIYSGGSIYNPAQVIRTSAVRSSTEKIDKLVSKIASKTYSDLSVNSVCSIIELTRPDQSQSERVWNPLAVAESIVQLAKLRNETSIRVYVDRDRGLRESRRETQGILDGGEASKVPADGITLFLLRTAETGARSAAWWPQIRFPDGAYAFAFSL